MYRNDTPLWRIGLACFGLTLAACGGGSDEDSTFELAWSVEYLPYELGSPRERVTCENADTPTIRFEALSPRTGSPVYSADFPCAPGIARTAPLAPGDYAVRVSLLSRSGVVISQWDGEGVLWPIHSRGGTYFGRPIGFAVQALDLAWSVKRAGAFVRCSEVGATQVELDVLAGEMRPMSVTFPCSDGRGTTPALVEGTYGLTARLLNAAGMTLAQQTMTLPIGRTFRAVATPVEFEVK